MDKETVSSLATQDLSTFPLDDFFDQYEKGLRKVRESFYSQSFITNASLITVSEITFVSFP